MRLARASLALLALAVCGWFALGIRQAHDTAAATAIIPPQGPVSAEQVSRATSLLRDARQLNPDQQVNVLLAQLTLVSGHAPRARQILGDVVRREPQNLDAWAWLAHASANEPHAFNLALRRVRQLEPSVPPPP
jgi:cytochrome c-type biogenesis protein CcmH/NrfG